MNQLLISFRILNEPRHERIAWVRMLLGLCFLAISGIFTLNQIIYGYFLGFLLAYLSPQVDVLNCFRVNGKFQQRYCVSHLL
jgi:hypothetical protein